MKEIKRTEPEVDYTNLLEKKDLALLYRELRDSIVNWKKMRAAVPDHYYEVLGKLKIILNVMD